MFMDKISVKDLALFFDIDARECVNYLQMFERDNGLRLVEPAILDAFIPVVLHDKIMRMYNKFNKNLLEEAYVISEACGHIPIVPPGPNIYFLLLDNIIIYIGQSTNVVSRLGTHIENGRIFNRTYVLPTVSGQLDVMELLYINTFQPKENIVGLSNKTVFKHILGRVNISEGDLG
jgi:hypothetical protein